MKKEATNMKNVELTGKMMSFDEIRAFEDKKYGLKNHRCGNLGDVVLDAFIPIMANLKHLKEEDDMALNPYVMALEILISHAKTSTLHAIKFAEDRIGRIELIYASDRHPYKEEGELLGIHIDATDNRAVPEIDKIFVYDVECVERALGQKEKTGQAA